MKKNRSFRKRQSKVTRNLQAEFLEDRHLLAITLDPVAAINENGFAMLTGPGRVYEVHKTNNAPTIDGIRTSEAEWGDAAPASAGWVRIREQGDDNTNNRFQAVYDDSGLYTLHEVDYDAWQPSESGIIDFNYENINFYFDPNNDGETNDQLGPDDTGILIVRAPKARGTPSPENPHSLF